MHYDAGNCVPCGMVVLPASRLSQPSGLPFVRITSDCCQATAVVTTATEVEDQVGSCMCNGCWTLLDTARHDKVTRLLCPPFHRNPSGEYGKSSLEYPPHLVVEAASATTLHFSSASIIYHQPAIRVAVVLYCRAP